MSEPAFTPRLNPSEAPTGFYAVLKSDAKPQDGSNICRACDWRSECQKAETDLARHDHRCMSSTVIATDDKEITRNDRCSVVFKRMPEGGAS